MRLNSLDIVYHLPARPIRSAQQLDLELGRIISGNIGVLDAATALKYIAYRVKALGNETSPRSTLVVLFSMFHRIESVLGKTPCPIAASGFSSTVIGMHNQCNIWELSESTEKTCCFLQAYSDGLRGRRDIDHLVESMHVWSVQGYFLDEPSNYHRLARNLMQLAGEYAPGIPLELQKRFQDESEAHGRRIKEQFLATKCRVNRLDYHLSRYPKYDRPTMAFLLDLVGEFDKAPFVDYCEHLLDEVELRLDAVASGEVYNAAEDLNQRLSAGESIGPNSGSLQTIAHYAIDSWENNEHEDVVYYDWDHEHEYLREERHEESIDGDYENSSGLGAIDEGLSHNEHDPAAQCTKCDDFETTFNLVNAGPATDDTDSNIARRDLDEMASFSLNSPDQAIDPLRFSRTSSSQDYSRIPPPQTYTAPAAKIRKEGVHQEREDRSDRLRELVAELEHGSGVTDLNLQHSSLRSTTLYDQEDQTASCTATVYEATDAVDELYQDKVLDFTSCHGNERRRDTSDSLLDEFETATWRFSSMPSSDHEQSEEATGQVELTRIQPRLANSQKDSTPEQISSTSDARWMAMYFDPGPASKLAEKTEIPNSVSLSGNGSVEKMELSKDDEVEPTPTQPGFIAKDPSYDPEDPSSKVSEIFEPANSSANSEDFENFSALISKIQKSTETLSDLMASTPVMQGTDKVVTSRTRRNTSSEDSISAETEYDMRMSGMFEADSKEGEEEHELDRRLTATTEAFLENLRRLEIEWPFRSSESWELEQNG